MADLLEKANNIGDADATRPLMNLVMQFRKVCNHPELFERADVVAPFSFCAYAKAASIAREGDFVVCDYFTRSFLVLDIPELFYKEGRLSAVPGENSQPTPEYGVLINLLSIWSTSWIQKSFEEDIHSPFCFACLTGLTAGEIHFLHFTSSAERLAYYHSTDVKQFEEDPYLLDPYFDVHVIDKGYRLKQPFSFRHLDIAEGEPALHELHPSSQDLRAAAKPAFGRSRSRKGEMSVDNKALQEIMLEKAAKQVQKITSEKESEWVRRGGKLKERVGLKDITEENVASKLAATILEMKGDAFEHPDENQQSESSDEDWAPTHEDGGESDDGCDHGIQKGQKTGIQSDADDSDGEEEGVPVFHPNRTKKVAKRTVASESEEELGNEHVPKRRVLVPDTSFVDNSDGEYQRQQALLHRGSRSSFEGSLPDDEDKENNENLMFDNGEDKENVAIPLHLPAQSGSISRCSPSPDVSDDFSDKENGPIRQRLFTSEPPAMSISIGTSGPLNVASPMTIQPAFHQGPSRFRQFFDDDERFEEPAGGDENSRPMHSSSPELRPVVLRGVLSQAFSQGEEVV